MWNRKRRRRPILQKLRTAVVNLRRIPRRTTSHGLLKPVWWGIGVYACLAGGSLPLNAQLQMPDAKQMSGIPRPVTDLPNGAVSVRLIRGDLSHNITNLPVELQVDSEVRTGKTDEGGRAQFSDLPPGARLKAVAVVDGERYVGVLTPDGLHAASRRSS